MSGGWNTIESDAGVFTYLLSSLGVQNVQFEELVSLDADTLASINALGVIFLFKYPTSESSRNERDPPFDGQFDFEAMELGASTGGAQGVWFANQTIQNACGTQALLSVLMNKAGTAREMATRDAGTLSDKVMLGTELTEFRNFTSAFPPDLRGEALSNSSLIRDAHNSFARSSPFLFENQRTASNEDDDVYHFIAYTSINDTLYELDGLQAAPISHGPCTGPQFAERIIPVLQRRIQRYPAHEIRFNLLAMCPDLRARFESMGDEEGLAREHDKRRHWQWENSLRRHNFVAFIGALLKDVVADKTHEAKFDEWVASSTEQTVKRREERRSRVG